MARNRGLKYNELIPTRTYRCNYNTGFKPERIQFTIEEIPEQAFKTTKYISTEGDSYTKLDIDGNVVGSFNNHRLHWLGELDYNKMYDIVEVH